MVNQQRDQIEEQLEENYRLKTKTDRLLSVTINPTEYARLKLDLEFLEGEIQRLEGKLDSLENEGSQTKIRQSRSKQGILKGSTRNKVFISYSEADQKWLERLQTHLAFLERTNKIDRWDKTRIKLGMNHDDELMKALAATKVAVLLVSADFLASPFITNKELTHLLAANQSDGVAIFPVIVSECTYEESPLENFYPLNPSRPLDSMKSHNWQKYLANLARSIIATVNS